MDAERQTFLELVDRHGTTVLAMLRRLCGNRHDADDVFQEVAARVWLNLQSRPRLRSPRAWLLTIAYRQFLDHRARCRVHVTLLDHDAPRATAGPSTRRGLRSEVMRRGCSTRRFRSCRNRCASIIVLHYTGGLSLRETAQAVGVSVGTVKSRLNTCLTQLRRCLS